MGQFSNSKLSPNTFITDNTALHSALHSVQQERHDLIGNIVNSKINRITDNPFYFFSGMSMTQVIFYNINPNYTTLDETLENTYNFIGPASGLRFDKIIGVILYGLGRMELNIDMGEFGTEADPIEGEAYIPPNTFKPYQNSYFSIIYLNQLHKKEILFRVTSVNIDTFPNGANYYKISYKLESIGEDINPQIINTYQFLSSGNGDYGGSLIDAESYGMLTKVQDIINDLKTYYVEMFFQQSTQMFVFKYGFFDYFFYDPYLINFIERNHIFATNDDNYLHICQPAEPPPYLNIDYNHTVFRLLEKPENTKVCHFEGYGILVRDPMSLLTHRMEPYYMITLRDDDGCWMKSPLLEPIPLFDGELSQIIPGYLDSIDGDKDKCPCGCKELLDKLDVNRKYYKILYAYFNGETITSEMISFLETICFRPCKELYYTIPMLIYILNKYCSSLSTTSDDLTNPLSNAPQFASSR